MLGTKSLIVYTYKEDTVNWRKEIINWGGRWDFRFWPFSRSGFRFLQWKTSVFRFCCPLWFPVFPFFSIWFSVFWQKQRGFSDLGDRCGFRFFQFGRTSKMSTNPHGLPMWFLWLCPIINCLQVTILLLQACLFWYDRRSQKLFSAAVSYTHLTLPTIYSV